MKIKMDTIIYELKEHIPFTSFATIIGIIISLIIMKMDLFSSVIPIFYIFHPAHLFFSAIVSTSMLYNYKKKIFSSLVIGGLISLIIGSLSDIIFPYLGVSLFGIPISFHLPEIETPFLTYPFILLGSVTGIIFKKTKFPHFLHVFISVFASLFYVFGYSSDWNFLNLFLIILITIFSVVIPCCLGDIVFPLIIQERLNKIKLKLKK